MIFLVDINVAETATRLIAFIWYCLRLIAESIQEAHDQLGFFLGQPHRKLFSTLQAGASGSGDEKCGCLRVNRHHAHQARGGERASHRPVAALPGVLLPDVHGHGSGRRFPGNLSWGLSRVGCDTRCPSTHLLFCVLCLVAALRRMCFVSDEALLPCHIKEISAPKYLQ